MGLSLSIKMNREGFPKSGAGATAKVTVRVTRAELRALDRFCAERLLSRSQGVQRDKDAYPCRRSSVLRRCSIGGLFFGLRV
jgi:hypothetical protein